MNFMPNFQEVINYFEFCLCKVSQSLLNFSLNSSQNENICKEVWRYCCNPLRLYTCGFFLLFHRGHQLSRWSFIVAQDTCAYTLPDRLQMWTWGCTHLYLELCGCDRITQDRWCQTASLTELLIPYCMRYLLGEN